MPYASSIEFYDNAGAGAASYALPIPTSYGLILRCFQVLERGGAQVAYYSGVTDGTPADDAGSATIYAYDLTNDVALPDLDVRDRVTDGIYLRVDSLTALSDGSLVACWTESDPATDRAWATRCTLRVYDTSDALTDTYVLPTSDIEGAGFLADAIRDESVILSLPGQSSGMWTICAVEPRAATISETMEIPTPGATAGVVPVFLTSIDKIVLTTAPTPGPFTGEPPVRWVRRTPHEVNQLKRLFFGRTELLVDVGSGGTSNTVAQRYSNDGGQTWSTPITRSLGTAGDFGKRVFWPVNGSGRDRVWEWSGEGDAPAKIVDAFVEVKGGTS